jgi:hypothetical protein
LFVSISPLRIKSPAPGLVEGQATEAHLPFIFVCFPSRPTVKDDKPSPLRRQVVFRIRGPFSFLVVSFLLPLYLRFDNSSSFAVAFAAQPLVRAHKIRGRGLNPPLTCLLIFIELTAWTNLRYTIVKRSLRRGMPVNGALKIMHVEAAGHNWKYIRPSANGARGDRVPRECEPASMHQRVDSDSESHDMAACSTTAVVSRMGPGRNHGSLVSLLSYSSLRTSPRHSARIL